MYKVVLLRHGESDWNRENRFTGWTDVDLSDKGRAEAKAAGQLLKDGGLHLRPAFTSVLKRAIRTLWLALDEMDLLWLPVERSWRLNERHYGALQGLNKAETAAKFGEDQVKIWRRSYDIPPPPLATDDPRFPGHDPRYARSAAGRPAAAPSASRTPSPASCPTGTRRIAPAIRAGKRVIIAAHGNSLRALVKYLDDISDAGHRRAEHPHRHPAGLRAGRQPAADQALLPRRPRRGEAGGRGGGKAREDSRLAAGG